MPLTQEQVNQLAKEAAAQAGGTISYQDAIKAAAIYGITPEQVNAALSTGVITGAPLAQQILATSDPTKWTGEGFGSAQANAEDMAKILSGIGITDISQFGKVKTKQEERVSVRPVYDDNGNAIGYADQDNNILSGIDAKNVIASSYGEGPTNYELITQKDVDSFGNKLTGQTVGNTYGERQTGDAFGGTYAGSGNTGYRVQFRPDGSPVFYTSEQSSSDMGDVMPFIQLALMATGAGGLLGGALNQGLGLGLGSVGSAALGGATIGGLTSAATGGNVLQGALLGGAGGYLSNALSAGITDKATLQAAMDADIAGGMVPEFGTNAAYDNFMANAMTPAARLALETQIASGNGAWLGENVPSGVTEWDQAFTNAGGTFDTAYTTPTTTATRTDLPQASYSNEGRNYPTPASTQGSGGSPANVSVSTPGGLPLIDTTGSGISISPNTAINAARLAAGLLGGGAVAGALTNTSGGSNVSPTQGVPAGNQDYYNAIQQYYNAYMPTQPKDVATPLQNWYSNKYGA